jgi:inner membrane protein
MASIVSHAIVATVLGSVTLPRRVSWWYWALGAVLAVIPDADVIGLAFGIRYEDVLGHRGLSHSIFFAAILAASCSFVLARRNEVSTYRLFLFLFLATASHGLLDAMTNGGLGVAFFAPFNNDRFFFPFRPIEVSPIGIDRFFSARGLAVIQSEAKWLWIPSALVFIVVLVVRKLKTNTPDNSART